MKGLTAPERFKRAELIKELEQNRKGRKGMPPKEVRDYIAKLEQERDEALVIADTANKGLSEVVLQLIALTKAATDVVEDNDMFARQSQAPQGFSSYGIDSRKLWTLKKLIPEID